MKKKILFIIIVCLSKTCFSQNQAIDCSQFKTGKFSYRDSSGIIYEMKRMNKHQSEFNPQTKLMIKYKIEWIGDCEYKLTQLWASKKEARKLNNSWLVYRILSVNDNTYEYTCTCSDNSKISGVVVKNRY